MEYMESKMQDRLEASEAEYDHYVLLKESVKQYFKILDWKNAAEKTKLGDRDYIDPKGYDAALLHYRKLLEG